MTDLSRLIDGVVLFLTQCCVDDIFLYLNDDMILLENFFILYFFDELYLAGGNLTNHTLTVIWSRFRIVLRFRRYLSTNSNVFYVTNC